MPEQMSEYGYDSYTDVNTRMRDLEERMRLLKDRVILIGQNFIESKEASDAEFQEMKSEFSTMKKSFEKIKEKIQLIGEELEFFSRREEVALLRKQFKMFEPLRYARIEDVEKIIEVKLKEGAKEAIPGGSSLEKDKRGYIF